MCIAVFRANPIISWLNAVKRPAEKSSEHGKMLANCRPATHYPFEIV
jgi:hypothetical protein